MKRMPNISTTLLIAAIVVTALSFVMPKNKEKYLKDMFWSKKTFAPAKYDVVLMGDSRIYRGLSPDIMEEILPDCKILNFGYSNGGLNPTMFKAAEQKLAKNAKHKIIVMGITANTITNYTQNNNQYLQELTRAKEEVLERMYLNPILYWFSATTPKDLKNNLKPKEIPTSYYHTIYHMNGYAESDKFPIDTTEAIPSYTKDFNNYTVNKEKLQQLYAQVKEWTNNGVIVIGFRPPTSQPMVILEDTLANFNEAKIKKEFISSGGNWIDINPSQFKTYDGSHLDKNSAKKLSLLLSEEIKTLPKN